MRVNVLWSSFHFITATSMFDWTEKQSWNPPSQQKNYCGIRDVTNIYVSTGTLAFGALPLWLLCMYSIGNWAFRLQLNSFDGCKKKESLGYEELQYIYFESCTNAYHMQKWLCILVGSTGTFYTKPARSTTGRYLVLPGAGFLYFVPGTRYQQYHQQVAVIWLK